MSRVVPGSGASIFPIFNSIYGVREVYVTDGGSGYDPADPPRLRIGNCGTPIRDAVLRAVIEGDNGEITAVEVLDPGEGYDPLRLEIGDDNATVPAEGKVFLKDTGAIDFIQMTQFGDEYFAANAEIKGGGGSGSELVPITGLVTGLSIEEFGRNYTEEDINIIISGGGGQGATGVAGVNQFGKVTAITLTNQGEFFEDPPLIQIIGGGGSGAIAESYINLGVIDNIDLLAGGDGYVTPPQVIFTRDTNLIKTARNRQSLNSVVYNLSGILNDVTTGAETIHVESTAPYPGSGKVLLGREVIRYTGKTATTFDGCDRGTNFRFDQKVILDSLQNDANTGETAYDFQVTDKVRRVIESASNRIAIVYDWDPVERALYLTFEVDELAFIDAGRSGEKSKIIAFFAGTSASSGTGVAPHTLIEREGSDIVAFTTPLSIIQNRVFEDDDEEFVDENDVQQFGDGIPDLLNTGTDYENQVNLDGGIASSKYGIEEELGGTNTTLFQIGDQIYDGSPTQLVATVASAGALGDGDAHISTASITIEYMTSSLFSIPTTAGAETVTGQTSGIAATTTNRRTGEREGQFVLDVQSIVSNDPTYKFSPGETLQGNSSGAQAKIIAVEYNNFLRNEGE
jgi:hypothetical protein